MSLASRHWFLPCAALCAALALPAVAQDGQGRSPRRGPPVDQRDSGPTPAERSMQSQRRGRSGNDEGLSDSIRRVERSTRGQVLSVEQMVSDGRDVNRIKVVDPQGRVRIYMDDPQAPRVPRTRGDDD